MIFKIKLEVGSVHVKWRMNNKVIVLYRDALVTHFSSSLQSSDFMRQSRRKEAIKEKFDTLITFCFTHFRLQGIVTLA